VIVFLIIAGFVTVNFALAQGLDVGMEYGEQIGLGSADPRIMAANVIRIALGFLGIIAVGLIIYAGWLYMTAAGQEEKIEKAKKILINAIIGLVIILSAFAIASFVLNRFLEATTPGVDLSGDGTDDDWSTPDASSNEFFVSSISPSGGNVIRNAKIRFNFNKTVDATTVKELTLIVNDSEGSVAGARTVNGRTIEFVPDSPCPDNPCGAKNCFTNGLAVTVEVVSGAGGILSVDGKEINCSLGATCKIGFTVGNVIDCEDPTVNLSFDNGQVCVGANNISANSTDDSGVASIEFFADGISLIDTSVDDSNPNPVFNPSSNSPFSASVIWGSGTYTVGKEVVFKATAFDLDDHSKNDEKSTKLRPAHCCNGTLDTDAAIKEDGVDCGGKDCASCEGAACGIKMSSGCSAADSSNCDNSRCSSNFCNCGTYPNVSDSESCQTKGYTAAVANKCCVCENAPRIDWITPIGGFCKGSPDTPCQSNDDCTSPDTCDTNAPNGAFGNFVTIGGKYFGSTKGKATFLGGVGDSDNKEASLCNDKSWQDGQITVIVPTGAVNGPIKVTEAGASGYEDTTDNERGAFIPSFVVNNIARPGICSLDTNRGIMNKEITYQGVNLLAGKAYFGAMAKKISALDSKFAVADSGKAKVPNIKTGKTATFVLNDGLASNYLDFTKDPEPYVGPKIDSFEPVSGAPGQYVTIRGSGFGGMQGASKVYFGDVATGKEASYQFPKICADSIWSDKQVIVKVPVDSANSFINMEIVRVSEKKTYPISSKDQFTVNSAPLTPSLCKIDPTMGPTNSSVSLWGENFGDKATGLVRFYSNRDKTGITDWAIDNSASGTIKPYKITTTVPQEAQTGPVQVVQDTLVGNSLNFTVGSCASNDDCAGNATDKFCCPAGSSEAGKCKENIKDDCYITVASSVYEWEFSTGDNTPPVTPYYSCLGKSKATGKCDSGGTCPNSPGKCSFYGGGAQQTVVDCSDAYCSSVRDGWTYNSVLNKCIDPVQGECDLNDPSATDALGNKVAAYCAKYNSGNYWHIDTKNCPDGWTKISGDKCVDMDSTCRLCSSSSVCLDDKSGDPKKGLCAINQDICPSGYTCNATSNKCELKDCGDGYCNDVRADCDSRCTYNSTLNKCATTDICDLNDPLLTKDIEGKKIVAYCAEYSSIGRWHIDTKLNCPSSDWTKIGDKCVNTKLNCGVCGSGFACLDDKSGDHKKGLCAINQDVCPGGFTCNATSNKCVPTNTTGCECCCRLDNSKEDCCAPLTCEGNCGSDVSGTDTDTYGRCSGCANVSTDQTLRDAACNCAGHSGKICDASAPGGVCRDCEGLSKTECSSHSTCCVDAMNGEICRGGTGNPSIIDYDNLAYCEYYQCEASGDACDPTNNPVASSTRSVYGTEIECGEKCSGVSRPGETCLAESAPSTCSSVYGSCGTGYGCMATTDDVCGTCCCNPKTPEVNPNGLICVPNKLPCTSDTGDRGLYCGCQEDKDCGSEESAGCSSDTCCRTKPTVLNTYPADTGVCRNTLISASFDQKMDIASFSGNIVVVGDYEDSVCPTGTQYLALNKGAVVKKNIAASFYQKILSILAKAVRPLFGGKVLAGTTDPNHNYCSLAGKVSGIDKADGTSDLIFSLNKPLDPTRKYYVIIKGDEGFDSSKGVLSNWGIGLNEEDIETFSGKTFTKAKIWSFTTGNEICQLESVKIVPESYVFQKAGAIGSWDFEAKPYSSGGQIINSVTGYSWGWNWSSDNEKIVSVVNSSNSIQTATAQNIKDGKTFIKATATITEDIVNTPSTKDKVKTGQAEVYVFLCENIWPPIISGTWAPWRDEGTNCLSSTGDCANTNYELYYCRDKGAAGSADDLPAILSDTIIRGASLMCVGDTGNCSSLGATCGSLGKCQYDILKEAYFFREETPGMASDVLLSGAALPRGKTVKLTWHKLGRCDNGESCGVGLTSPCSDGSECVKDTSVSGYKIYYGADRNNFNAPINVNNADTLSVELGQGAAAPFNITDLNNGDSYYFAVTAYYGDVASNIESALSNVIEIKVEDTIGPAAPTMTLTPGDKKVVVSWVDGSGEAVNFRVYYKATSDCSAATNFGDSQVAIKSPVTISGSGLNNEAVYCFGLVAYDAENNEGEKAIGSAAPTRFEKDKICDGDIIYEETTHHTTKECLDMCIAKDAPCCQINNPPVDGYCYARKGAVVVSPEEYINIWAREKSSY